MRFLLAALLLSACHQEPRTAPPSPSCGPTGTWRDGPLFTLARGGHSATLLPDDLVLLWGGSQNLHVPDGFGAETFDPAGLRNGTGFEVPLRSGHRAALLPDGRVLILGGTEAFHAASPILFDPVAGQRSPGSSADAPAEPTPPAGAPPGAALAWLPAGRVLAAGGHDASGVPHANASLWTGTAWCPLAPMRAPRTSAAAVVLRDGTVLVTGGRTGGPREMDPFIRTTELFAIPD